MYLFNCLSIYLPIWNSEWVVAFVDFFKTWENNFGVSFCVGYTDATILKLFNRCLPLISNIFIFFDGDYK